MSATIARLGRVSDYRPAAHLPRLRLDDRSLMWVLVRLRDAQTGERYQVTAGARDLASALALARDHAREQGVRAVLEDWEPVPAP